MFYYYHCYIFLVVDLLGNNTYQLHHVFSVSQWSSCFLCHVIAILLCVTGKLCTMCVHQEYIMEEGECLTRV